MVRPVHHLATHGQAAPEGTRPTAVWKTLEKGPHRRWVLARELDGRRTCLIGKGEFVPWEKTGVPDFGRCGGDGGGEDLVPAGVRKRNQRPPPPL